MFDDYQRIRIINLPEREDRRREMRQELKRIGLNQDPRVKFFPAIRPADEGPFRAIGVHGVYLSHLAVLKEAAAAGESVLILEDDCDFTAAVGNPRPRSDLLWGGYVLFPAHIEGAHCMGFSAAITRRVATYLDELLKSGPIDVDGAYIWFCRDHPDVVVDAPNPNIAVQRPSYSDIAGRRGLDRLGWAKPLINVARKIKRAGQRNSLSKHSFEELVASLRAASQETGCVQR